MVRAWDDSDVYVWVYDWNSDPNKEPERVAFAEFPQCPSTMSERNDIVESRGLEIAMIVALILCAIFNVGAVYYYFSLTSILQP